jgi:hypothetical protein
MGYQRRRRYFMTSRYNNGQGTAIRCGDPDTVLVNGWESGVRVNTVDVQDEPDKMHVYMTFGTNANTYDVWLGTVHATPNGPVWEPRQLDQERYYNAPTDDTERAEYALHIAMHEGS